MNNNINIDKVLDKAKIGIMQTGSAFLSTIVFNLIHKFNADIPTACTNGLCIEYNPDFFLNLSPEQRVTLIAHEAWHVALSHLTRKGNKDQKIYNQAGDYVINQILKDAGFEKLVWENPDGSIGEWLQDNKYKNMSTNQVYDIIYIEPPPDNEMGNDIKYLENGKPDPQQKKDIKKIENKIKDILVKADIQSKLNNDTPGAIPAEISRQLDKLLNPRLPWDAMLQQFLTDKVKDDYSWARPNKRFMPEFYLPTQYSEALAHLTIAIDTSGSVSKEDLTKMLTEIVFIKSKFNPKKLTLIDCDSKIHNVYDVDETTDILSLSFQGGGGTRFEPVFEYIEKHPTTALIYFTDLYANQITKEVDYPVLWIVYDNPDAKVKIGEITHYDINA